MCYTVVYLILGNTFLIKSGVKNARKALTKGDKAKISIRFKGRQIAHPELAKDVLLKFIEEVTDIADIEISPKMEGRSMFMQLTPKK